LGTPPLEIHTTRWSSRVELNTFLGTRSAAGSLERESNPNHGFTGSKGSHMRELFLLDGDDADDAGWQERALCAQTDPEAFFPEKGGSTREAKKVCLTCEVRTDCLESALMNDERFGIWGGLSERERRKLKKRAV